MLIAKTDDVFDGLLQHASAWNTSGYGDGHQRGCADGDGTGDGCSSFANCYYSNGCLSSGFVGPWSMAINGFVLPVAIAAGIVPQDLMQSTRLRQCETASRNGSG